MNKKRHHHTPFAAWMMGAAAALSAAPSHAIDTYPGDPGALGNAASWRTAEFNRDWGLRSIGAEFAYAAGFSGSGVKVGIVDSGYFDQHPELTAGRYNGVTVNGTSGAWNPAYNDSHGTHVVGTVAAGRDGGTAVNNFHGVAFNATLYVGNTRKTDGVLFGMPQATQSPAQTLDQGYVADVYRGVNAQNVRIIGTSWGSQPNTEQYQTLFPTTGTNLTGRAGLMGSWTYLSRSDVWMAGALDAARTGTVMLFSAGNTGYANASARSAAGYFLPELEGTWLAVAAVRQSLTIGGVQVGQTLNPDGSVNVPGAQLYNQCGVAKWSCVTAPGNAINGSTVTPDASPSGGSATYAAFSGTSMAQPHASGALAVIMERFSYLTNEQAVTVMKTTALQNGTISDAAGAAIANPTAGQRVVSPDARNGWGTVSLREAMGGPGQFIGRFAVDTQGQSDTWTNSISDVAIRGRATEDAAEAAAWTATKIAKGWTNGLPAGTPPDDVTEYTVGMAREAARDTRVYNGSLAKSGAGTLTLTGLNSYTGGTEVLGGRLVGLSAAAFGSGDVTVRGGTLGGSTTIAADLLNIGGTVAPGLDGAFGTLRVLGTFEQMAAGVLALDFLTGGSDLLEVAGVSMLGGGLDVSFEEGYATTGLYILVSSASTLGSFASFHFDGLAAGYTASLVYSATGVQINVSAVPEAGTWMMWLTGLFAVGCASARRRAQ